MRFLLKPRRRSANRFGAAVHHSEPEYKQRLYINIEYKVSLHFGTEYYRKHISEANPKQLVLETELPHKKRG